MKTMTRGRWLICVIPSEVEGSRGITLRFGRGIPRLRFASLGMTARFCAAVLLSTTFVSLAHAQSDVQFAKANQEYGASHFKEAIDNYEALIRGGQYSANLFYNLGNAYFRIGDFGRSILNYERALALDRNHPESEANMRLVRDEARALEMQQSMLERRLQFASLNQYSVTAAVAFWIAMLCITGLIFSRRRSMGAVTMSILLLASFAVSAFAIYEINNGNRGRALAIVTGKDVIARLATADNASSVLALPAGSEIKILSVRGDWIYAALPNNLRGWIPSKDAEQVRL